MEFSTKDEIHTTWEIGFSQHNKSWPPAMLKTLGNVCGWWVVLVDTTVNIVFRFGPRLELSVPAEQNEQKTTLTVKLKPDNFHILQSF